MIRLVKFQNGKYAIRKEIRSGWFSVRYEYKSILTNFWWDLEHVEKYCMFNNWESAQEYMDKMPRHVVKDFGEFLEY